MPNTREKLIELLSIGHECPDGRNPFLEESCSTCPYGKANNCGAEMQADHLIANGVTLDNQVASSKWISVKDRLPNYFEHVLINVPGDKPFTTVHEARLRKDGLWDTGLYRYEKEDVTHWTPLPQPPKGE